MKISVVSPVYKAEKIIEELVLRIEESVSKITDDYEIILVCDGSPDNSWNEIARICRNNKQVVGINLSRNFGQHYAISSGLKYAKGDWVVLLDCDLQDDPDFISLLYEKVMQGYDMAVAKRENRQDSYMKCLSSVLYNKVYQYLSDITIDSSISNYGIYSKKVIQEYNKMIDVSRSFQSLIGYLGFKIAVVKVRHAKRYEGKSSYSWKKLLRISSDIIISNSNKPLKIALKVGFLMTVISIVLIIYNLANYLSNAVVPGFSSTIISIWFVGGINVFILGILGLYIDKIFNQVKCRPIYIVSEIINLNDEK